MAANKAAGCQFEWAIKCRGVDMKPNLATVKYDDFCFTEGRSSLEFAFEMPKNHGAIGRGVRGHTPSGTKRNFG